MIGQPTATTDPGAARLLWLLGGCALVSLPFVAVEFVPATDLPQHVAQIRLLEELWDLRAQTIDTSYLEARPFSANTLVYWPLFLFSRLFPLRLSGKLTAQLILIASVWSLHHLAQRRERDPAHALVAMLPLFSAPFYWGFLNFLCGLPLWLLFTARVLDAEHTPGRAWTRLLGDATLVCSLYGAHVFWVAAAGLVTAVHEARRPDLKRFLARSTCFVPAMALIVAWYPEFVAARRDAGFELGSHYLIPLSSRWSWSWLVNALFGGVRGWVEPAFTLVLLAYMGMVVARDRRSMGARGIDGALAAIALLLLAFALFAPDQHMNTIFFNRRFFPVSAMLLLLSLPSTTSKAPRVIAAASAALFILFTTFAWALFDQDDLSGLRESLAKKPEAASTLGLDYRAESAYLRDRPFLQIAAYAQASRGGDLMFSFAEHASSIVAFRVPRRLAWTPGLEWYPERATLRDIAAFDCTLVNGTPAHHARFATWSTLKPLTNEGHFRLYCHPTERAAKRPESVSGRR